MPHPIGADPAPARLATVALAAVVQRLGRVLHDLPFPADAWQVHTQAEIYGADATTRVALRALPAGRYRNLRTIAAALRRSPRRPRSDAARCPARQINAEPGPARTSAPMSGTLRAAIGIALAQLETGHPRDAILAEVTRAEAALADHPVSAVLATDITALLAETRRCAEAGLRTSSRLRLARHRVLTAFHTC
jgi:hypothetical protein